MRPIVTIGAAILMMAPLLARAEAKDPAALNQPVDRRQELERKILANLLSDSELKNDRIDVTVDEATVTLKGKIGSESERAKAIRLAQVDGISVIHDRLEVGSRDVQAAVTDTAVTTDLKARYLADDVLRHASIAVATNNGVVTLNGAVPSRAAHSKAVEIASSAKGVSRVEDHLKIASQ